MVAVVNWGLGHATRMVPLIDELLQRDVRVSLASSGVAGKFLKLRYPDLTYHELADYRIRYPSNGWMAVAMLRNWPAIAAAIKKENQQIQDIAGEEQIDVVISDNRYGCFLKNAKSILVTHQVCPLVPGRFSIFQPLFHRYMRRLIHRFDECWIPDDEHRKLSGKLSDSSRLKMPVRFLGVMSRFRSGLPPAEKKYDWLAIISGPEPQRSFLQSRFVESCVAEKMHGIVVAGRPGTEETVDRGIRIIPHLQDAGILQLIAESRYVLMRPGYSSLMDFLNIGTGALLVPTPGQTEQHYLAARMSRYKQFVVQPQSQLDLTNAGKTLEIAGGSAAPSATKFSESAIDRLFSSR